MMKKFYFLIFALTPFLQAAQIKNITIVNAPNSYQEPLVITAYLDGEFSTSALGYLASLLALSLGEHIKIEYQIQLMEVVPIWFDKTRADYTFTYDFWRDLVTGEIRATLTFSNNGDIASIKETSDLTNLVRHLGVIDNHQGVIVM